MPGQRAAAMRSAIGSIAACLAMLAHALPARAHDIPAEIRLNMFVKPAGQTLEVLVRVPLSAIREVDMPTRGPGYLVISKADAALRQAAKLWLIDSLEITENGARLPEPRIAAARVSLASDVSFQSYAIARAHVDGPRLADDLDLYWGQQLLDVLLEYPIASDTSLFAIHPRVDRLGLKVATALRFLPPGGAVRAFEFHGDPGLVRLDPRWHQTAGRFLASGVEHILGGIDHLLFLGCLVIPFRRLRPLVVIVSAFTVAHSIALIAAAFGFVPGGLWFPPLVETLIAATIVYTALENVAGVAAPAAGALLGASRRWVLAFAFGLVHGFGFSFALTESLQFAGNHLLTALLAFNLGVEIGQIAVLLVLAPTLALLFRYGLDARIGSIILSVLIAHTGWHWMLERGGELAKFPMPTLDAAFLAGAMRGGMAVLILAGLVWLASPWVVRWLRDPSTGPEHRRA